MSGIETLIGEPEFREQSDAVGLPELPLAHVWGLSLTRITTDGLVDLVDRLIEIGRPSFFITANLHYARLAAQNSRLAEVNRRAAFLVADGMPLVWYSRWAGCPLPQRVTGADSIYRLCQRAAERGHRVFLLGGEGDVAQRAAENLRQLWPELEIVGIESPMLSELTADEHAALVRRINAAKPDLLFAALGQPKGELWLADNLDALGVPACVQIGATFDFVAGRVSRAPGWMQRTGAEWLYRIGQEPRRMVPRYFGDGVFLLKAVLGGLFRKKIPAGD